MSNEDTLIMPAAIAGCKTRWEPGETRSRVGSSLQGRGIRGSEQPEKWKNRFGSLANGRAIPERDALSSAPSMLYLARTQTQNAPPNVQHDGIR